MRLAEEIGHQRLHATSGKKCGRIVLRHKRRRGDHRVLSCLKICEIFTPNFIHRHALEFTIAGAPQKEKDSRESPFFRLARLTCVGALFEHRKGLIESLQWNLDAKAVSIRIGYPKFDD